MKTRSVALIPLLSAITIMCTHMSTQGLSFMPKKAQADPPSIMGSGNFDLQYNSDFATQFDILNTNKVKLARINAYPGDYWNGSAPVTSTVMDNAIKLAHSKGITPIIHFSYYANNLSINGIQLGNKAKWTAIGQAYATRYRPNSPWLQSQGINNWGVTVYLALNEADLNHWWTHAAYNGVPQGTGIPINASSPYTSQFGGNYHDAMEGLSDGIKGVSSSLKVVNGGFATQNSARSYTATGYASGIADLFNNGKLDGLNLHTYNDAKYAPLYPDAGWNNEWSVLRQFGMVKSASGITRDLDFYCDEFNYKNVDRDDNGVVYDEDRTARQFFTMLWQHLGVTKNNGTSATKMAMIWTLFYGEDIYKTWNGSSLTPYSPRKVARTYAFVAEQTAGMEFETLDPLGKSEWTLTGSGKKAWVWTNMRSYTNHLGSPWTINGIPSGTSQVRVYGWDGFNGARQTINISAGQTSATIYNLPENETYMAVSLPGGSPTTNLLSNPSFDAENYDTQTPSGWSEWSDTNTYNAAYTETNGGSASGARHGTHWNTSAYRIYTYQNKTGLQNGLYTARCKARSGGGQSQAQFEVKDFGGTSRYVTIPVSGTYQTVEIKDINVTNGQITVGFWSAASANQWIFFDDVELFKQSSATLFSTGFENGQTQPSWSDSVDWSSNVSGYLSGISPECATRANEQGITGTALMYSGTANAASAHCYYRVFSVNIPVSSATQLAYKIYPQNDNGRYVGVDLQCSDGTVLRDSGATDSNGKSFHPAAGHGGSIPLNAWTTIQGNIGSKLGGKTITKIWVAFDRANGPTGQYRGYIDDIAISN